MSEKRLVLNKLMAERYSQIAYHESYNVQHNETQLEILDFGLRFHVFDEQEAHDIIISVVRNDPSFYTHDLVRELSTVQIPRIAFGFMAEDHVDREVWTEFIDNLQTIKS